MDFQVTPVLECCRHVTHTFSLARWLRTQVESAAQPSAADVCACGRVYLLLLAHTHTHTQINGNLKIST